MSRLQLLKEIIEAGPRMDQAMSQVTKMDFDSKTELAAVTRTDLLNILRRFIDNSVSSEQLESWANFIECRDDINYSEIAEEIYQFANPSLQGSSSRELALHLVRNESAT